MKLILGTSFPKHIGMHNEIAGGDQASVAQQTAFGLTIIGPFLALTEEEATETHNLAYKSVISYDYSPVKPAYRDEDVSCKRMMQLLLDVDRSPDDDRPAPSPDDEHCEKILKDMKRVDGRMQAGCLWREGEPNFPENNYESALRRQRSLEKSTFYQDEERRKTYGNTFTDWLSKGYLAEVPEEEHRKGKFYIAHFPVWRPDKPTSKCRPVLDCAFKGKAGKSLNDAMLSGPNLLADLPVLLTRMRKFPVAFSIDISEMFLRVRQKPEDMEYHRLLWRESPQDKIREFKLQVHAFGNAGSPAVAGRTAHACSGGRRDSSPRP